MEREKYIYVTSPAMPSFNKFVHMLKDIWKSKHLTNVGKYHRQFEKNLCEYLCVSHCNLTTNGTLAIILSLQALRITGEVITTPYSFPATTLHYTGMTLNRSFVILNIEP